MRISTISVDSALGRWTHSEGRSVRLAPVVEHMWHFTGRMSMPRERLFPGGYLEVILHLGPRFRDVDEHGYTASEFPIACVSGLQTRPAVIEAPSGDCCVLGIRLRPVAAYALFGDALSDALDQTLDLRVLGGADAQVLAEHCSDATSVQARFECVAQWILARVARRTPPLASIAWAARRLERSDGLDPIVGLREQTGMSGARFVEAFRRHTGVTPKRYARMLRFRRALTMLQSGRAASQVALDAGYFDQPHLHADFREFADMTPGEMVRAQKDPNSASLPEG